MKNWLKVVSASVLAVFAASAVADNDHGHDNRKRVFRANLVSLNEVPAVSSDARGQFYAVVNSKGDAFTYWLSYSGMSEDVSQSHIHFGNHHTNGGISVWLCQGTLPSPTMGTPTCAARATTTPITGTIDASDVIGPGGQGISAGEFDALLDALRAGAAYANVHSGSGTGPTQVGFPGGEIRGQID